MADAGDSPAEVPDFRWFDALRALAATIVVISHVRDLVVTDYAGGGAAAKLFYFVAGLGHAGVVAFFVLSGFWIAKSVTRRADRTDFWGDYLRDRLSRLGVVLVPALVLGGAIDWWGSIHLSLPLYSGATGAHSIAVPIDESFTSISAIGTLLFLQGLVVPPFGSNGPLWSLAYEFWFYIWFAAIWLAIRHRRPTVALAALGLALVEPALLWGFATWLTGAAAYAVVTMPRWRVSVMRAAWPLLAIGVAATAAALVAIRLRPDAWMDPPLGGAVAVLLVGLVATRASYPTLLDRVSRFGAEASFSLYAIHFPVAALAAAYLTREGRLPLSAGSVGAIVAITFACIAGARLFGALTEAHTGVVRHWLRQWRPSDSRRGGSAGTPR